MVHMVQKRNIKYEIVLALLREKEIHLRAISKLIKCPHSTAHREVIKLKERGIVDYETEGRNKFISLKKGIESSYSVYQAEYYKILRFIENHPEFSIIIEKILENSNAGLILLFGSYAKGNEKKDSDIDIFIETDDRKVREKIRDINSRLSVKIGKLDIDSLLGKEIIKDHIILKGVERLYEKNQVFGRDERKWQA